MPTAYPPGFVPVIRGVSVLELTVRTGGDSPFCAYTVVYMDAGGNSMGAVKLAQHVSEKAQMHIEALMAQLEADFIKLSSTDLHSGEDLITQVPGDDADGIELPHPQ